MAPPSNETLFVGWKKKLSKTDVTMLSFLVFISDTEWFLKYFEKLGVFEIMLHIIFIFISGIWFKIVIYWERLSSSLQSSRIPHGSD